MTVVNPKSISGINSITTGSGSDNLLTIHTSDASSTERVRINSSGDVIVGSGITVSPDGDIFATGVTTATTFSGSGASLTNLPAANITGTLPAISGANLTNLDASDLASGTVPTARLGSGTASSSTFLRGDSTFATVTSTTINNNADNRFITGSGTANTLEGESNFQFASNRLLYGGASSSLETSFVLKGNSNSFVTNPARMFLQVGQDAGGGASLGWIDFGCTGDKVGANIVGRAHQDFSGSNYSTNLEFYTCNPSSTTRTKKVQINAGGNLDIVDGNLKVASGHGIDFSATGDGSGTTSSEVLDDYEEGTFTPSFSGGISASSYTNQGGFYTKIGNQVFAYIYLRASSASTSGSNIQVNGLPYNCNNTSYHEGGGYITYINGFFGTDVTNAAMHCLPWVPLNQNYIIFHTPEDGNNVTGSETIPGNKYLIFHVRYTAA